MTEDKMYLEHDTTEGVNITVGGNCRGGVILVGTVEFRRRPSHVSADRRRKKRRSLEVGGDAGQSEVA